MPAPDRPGISVDDVIAGVGAVVYRYSNSLSLILLGTPPPWSLTLMVTSSTPLIARTGMSMTMTLSAITGPCQWTNLLLIGGK